MVHALYIFIRTDMYTWWKFECLIVYMSQKDNILILLIMSIPHGCWAQLVREQKISLIKYTSLRLISMLKHRFEYQYICAYVHIEWLNGLWQYMSEWMKYDNCITKCTHTHTNTHTMALLYPCYTCTRWVKIVVVATTAAPMPLGIGIRMHV